MKMNNLAKRLLKVNIEKNYFGEVSIRSIAEIEAILGINEYTSEKTKEEIRRNIYRSFNPIFFKARNDMNYGLYDRAANIMTVAVSIVDSI